MALTIHFATDDQNWPTASIVWKGGKKSRPEPITLDEFVVLSLIVARILGDIEAEREPPKRALEDR